MKFTMILASIALLSPMASAAAQDTPAPDSVATNVTIEEEVVGTLNNDANIFIPAFATDRDVATTTSAGSSANVGRQIAGIITSNLRNNGLFRPTGPDQLRAIAFGEVTAPQFPEWQGRSAEMLIHGFVRVGGDGKLTIGCYLYDVALGSELARQGYVVEPNEWRRAAHKCADMAYSRISGESPFFDSRIAYIAETGPKDRRMKRLAIMDSDGANHRFITTGTATALTPRYSPDYASIVYLSYLNGNPRIYIYDIGSGQQKLVTQSTNPTFAPRWSPDGRWILYSMAVAGNTDIYRVSVNGGESVRLTNHPGIDVGGSYSPDGSKIVFESDRSGGQQLYVMNADGSGQDRISFFGGRAATPEWSPRGDQIAFTHMGGNFRIAVMSPTGGSMRVLTDSWQDEAPTWSPNGRIVQFFRTERGSGRTGIWQVDLTGRNERRLQTPVDASDPAWGPVLP